MLPEPKGGRPGILGQRAAAVVGAVFVMPRSLGRCLQTSFARSVTYGLASFVVVIRMTVAPIPIRRLLLRFRFSKGTIIFVSLAEVLTIGTVFVVIPMVIVLVATVIDPVLVLIVSMVFFLAPIVLRLGGSTNCCWSGKGCSKKKGTEQISVTTVHVVFLLAQEFQSRNLWPATTMP
jgi:hypothetical protein